MRARTRGARHTRTQHIHVYRNAYEYRFMYVVYINECPYMLASLPCIHSRDHSKCVSCVYMCSVCVCVCSQSCRHRKIYQAYENGYVCVCVSTTCTFWFVPGREPSAGRRTSAKPASQARSLRGPSSSRYETPGRSNTSTLRAEIMANAMYLKCFLSQFNTS